SRDLPRNDAPRNRPELGAGYLIAVFGASGPLLASKQTTPKNRNARTLRWLEMCGPAPLPAAARRDRRTSDRRCDEGASSVLPAAEFIRSRQLHKSLLQRRVDAMQEARSDQRILR